MGVYFRDTISNGCAFTSAFDMLEESGWRRKCNIPNEKIPNLIGGLNGKKEASVERAIAKLRATPKNILRPAGRKKTPGS
jgi:hypothetical protein